MAFVTEWFAAFMVDADDQAGRPRGARAHEAPDGSEMLRKLGAGRIWFWVDQIGERGFNGHRVAVVSFLLVWAHGLYAGIDTELLLWLYLVTGLGLVALAVWRYAARTPADLVRALSDSPETAVRHSLRAVDSASSHKSMR